MRVGITNEDLRLVPYVVKCINIRCMSFLTRNINRAFYTPQLQLSLVRQVETRRAHHVFTGAATQLAQYGKSLLSFQSEMGALKVDKTAGNKSGGLRQAALLKAGALLQLPGLTSELFHGGAELYLCV